VNIMRIFFDCGWEHGEQGASVKIFLCHKGMISEPRSKSQITPCA
jgi:hypothetical protein